MLSILTAAMIGQELKLLQSRLPPKVTLFSSHLWILRELALKDNWALFLKKKSILLFR